jgi:hypothetical protein
MEQYMIGISEDDVNTAGLEQLSGIFKVDNSELGRGLIRPKQVAFNLLIIFFGLDRSLNRPTNLRCNNGNNGIKTVRLHNRKKIINRASGL